jgi:hypothetical protein
VDERLVPPCLAGHAQKPDSISAGELGYNLRRRWLTMKTRTILAAMGLLMYLLFTPMSAAAKEATVTLEISGMT